MIAIVDYGMGNVGSITNMLKKIGETEVVKADNPEILHKADKIILPGVGSFDMAVRMLKEKGFWNVLKVSVNQDRKPLLGICLGMQLLGYESEEGQEKGLGFIPFKCKKFRFSGTQLKVPHMGWDYVTVEQKECPLVDGVSSQLRYYFVHSFYAVCEESKDILMKCNYGHEFAAALHKDYVYGTQFHPEKSHRFGMELIENFARKC